MEVISQGVLNGQITKLWNNNAALTELMKGKSDKQILDSRKHLEMVRRMRKKK